MNVTTLDASTQLSILIYIINYKIAAAQTSERKGILLQLSCMVLKVQQLFWQRTLQNFKQQSSCDNLHGTTSREAHLTDECMVVKLYAVKSL